MVLTWRLQITHMMCRTLPDPVIVSDIPERGQVEQHSSPSPTCADKPGSDRKGMPAMLGCD